MDGWLGLARAGRGWLGMALGEIGSRKHWLCGRLTLRRVALGRMALGRLARRRLALGEIGSKGV